MAGEDWQIYLQTNHEHFVNNLDIEHCLLDACFSKKVLTKPQFNAIQVKSPKEEKVRAFLEILRALDSEYHSIFVAILYEKQADLGKKMAKALGFKDIVKQDQDGAVDNLPSSVSAAAPANAMTTEAPQGHVDVVPLLSEHRSVTETQEIGELPVAESMQAAQVESEIDSAELGRMSSGYHSLENFSTPDSPDFPSEEITQLQQRASDHEKVSKKLSDRVSKLEFEVDEIKKSHAKIDERININEMNVALIKNMNNDSQSLLIGDKIIKEICESNLQKTQATFLPDAEVADCIKHLRESDSSYNRIILCMGTNHCASPNFAVDDVIQQYIEIIDVAETKVDLPKLITVSSVPPRLDSKRFQRNVDELNVQLLLVAREKRVTYVDNDKNFKCLDGKPNCDYLQKDGVSLTSLGTDRLIKNLGLNVNPWEDGVVEKWLTCTAQ